MDRNSAIGLTLMAALLLVYFYFFSPSPQQPAPSPVVSERPSSVGDTTATADPAVDSARAASYGDLGSFVNGKEQLTTVETENLRIAFSNRGGKISELELKKYKTYTQKPLILVSPQRSEFRLQSRFQGKDIDLYDLFYTINQRKSGDTTFVSFALTLQNGGTLIQTYAVPDNGYEIRYRIEQKGLTDQFTSDAFVLQWNDRMMLLEKDIKDSRNNSTVTYHTRAEGFDNLAEVSDAENESILQPLNWVTIKQKFFLASIISKNGFANAELATNVNPSDTSIVEYAKVKLSIAKSALADGREDFKFYFGPNDYQEIGPVAEDFKKNVYLGWPPVYWINKYVIFPVFHFLTTFISNYGLIIVVLVILLKLVLAPLSYRSYLSMAKMKVLKPELDEIKEKHGDDMAKIQQEQLKLYQSVGVNPVSGCIPVLLQMPILFAMFYLFPASIELRQQPFLWAEDLSTYDSILRLPFTIPFGVGDHISLFTFLMTVSTLVYTWQNNQLSSVTGPMKTMSYIMPVIFFFVLNSFSAGLTFYYFISNLVTFAQQAIIRRFVDDNKIKQLLEENRKKNATGSGKKSKFMTRIEEAMKASEEARRKADEQRKKKK